MPFRYASALLAAVLLLALLSCSTPPAKEAEPVVPVQVADAQRGPIERIVAVEGILHPKDQAGIVPKISAPVRKFFVNRGDHVKQGQLLATLENRDLAAAVTDAKGTYDQAAASYRNTSSAMVPDEMVKAQQDAQAARQAMEAAQKVLASRQELLRQGALARRLVDEAAVSYAQTKSTYETAQAHLQSLQNVGRQEEVKGAQGQLESAKGKYDGAQAQLSYSEVRSPIDGVVTDRPLYAGELASAGTPLITVMDVSRVVARASVPIAEAAHLRVGNSASLVQTDGNIQASGRVTVVSPAVDPQSTTVEIWIETPNPGGSLRPGGTVRISIVAETIPDAVVIPVDALQGGQSGGTVVMVVGSDGVAHEHKVETGAREPEKVQIVKGIQPGDKVVTVGGVGLADGTKVKVIKPGEKEDDDKSAGAKDAKDKAEK